MPYRTLAGLFKKEPEQVDKKELLVQKILSVPIEDWKDIDGDRKIFSTKSVCVDVNGIVWRDNCAKLYFILKNRKIKKLARQLRKIHLNKDKQRKKEEQIFYQERDLDHLLKEV